MSDDSASYGLVVPFDTDDPEFTRGFEAGIFWAGLRQAMSFPERLFRSGVTMTVHASNAEMIMRMCEAAGCGFTARDLGDDWLHVTTASPALA